MGVRSSPATAPTFFGAPGSLGEGPRDPIVDLKLASEDTMVYLNAHHIVSIEDDD